MQVILLIIIGGISTFLRVETIKSSEDESAVIICGQFQFQLMSLSRFANRE